MSKLIMCQGLPGSGKSFWAHEQVGLGNGNTLRVNKDDIRSKLKARGWVWSQENEAKDVIPERDKKIIQGLQAGCTVISDDTNLQRVHKERLAQLAYDNQAEFEVRRFDTDLDTCIRRDAMRTGDAKVGEKVIREMAKKYINDYSSLIPYVANPKMPAALICDLDGTLADNSWRNPYDSTRCDEDGLIKPIYDIIRIHAHFNYEIIYLSGRDGIGRAATERFLKKHDCPPGRLFMREIGDKRKDWVVKAEIFDESIRHQYDVRFALDDRNQIVQMWRKLGLTCLQVKDGNF